MRSSPRSSAREWTREQIIQAFLLFKERNGRWPAAIDWQASEAKRGSEYPNYDRVCMVFTGWRDAVAHAQAAKDGTALPPPAAAAPRHREPAPPEPKPALPALREQHDNGNGVDPGVAVSVLERLFGTDSRHLRGMAEGHRRAAHAIDLIAEGVEELETLARPAETPS